MSKKNPRKPQQHSTRKPQLQQPPAEPEAHVDDVDEPRVGGAYAPRPAVPTGQAYKP